MRFKVFDQLNVTPRLGELVEVAELNAYVGNWKFAGDPDKGLAINHRSVVTFGEILGPLAGNPDVYRVRELEGRRRIAAFATTEIYPRYDPEHTCWAVFVSCMDFRFRARLNEFCNDVFGERNYDEVTLAGSGGVELSTAVNHIMISITRHHARKVVVLAHEQCAMYNTVADRTEELAAQRVDLDMLETRVYRATKPLEIQPWVDLLFMTLDGHIVDRNGNPFPEIT
jgi:hypothetical protein